MIRRVRKVQTYEEYFINDTRLKKLYNMYVHQSFFDKLLDILVFSAMLLTVMSVVMDYFGYVDNQIMILVHSFSVFILAIFGLE